MAAITGIAETAAPVSMRRVAGTGETEEVGRAVTGAEQTGQLAVDGAAALAVTPARRNDRAGDDAGALRTSPAHGSEVLVGMAEVPVGQEQFDIGGDGADDLTA